MALSSIISNLPVFRLFKTGQTANAPSTETPKPSGGIQDNIEISTAAQALHDSDSARTTAVATRAQLEQSSIALGLDPSFVE